MPFFAFYHKINPIFTIFVRFLLDLLPKIFSNSKTHTQGVVEYAQYEIAEMISPTK